MSALEFQAVLLAGGAGKRLYPLEQLGGGTTALLPVANKALISYPLKALSAAGLKHAFVVVAGVQPAASITSWIAREFSSSSGLQCEVITVPEEYGTADALRAVAPNISAKTFVVMSGDMVTDLAVDALVASHEMHSALATVVLSEQKVSPSSQTKPGKAPKNVDYVGLDPASEHLLFYASSPESLRDLKVPMSLIMQHGHMNVHSNLVDAHLYVFDRSLLATLEEHPKLSSLRQDLLPFLTQQQVKVSKQAQQWSASCESPLHVDCDHASSTFCGSDLKDQGMASNISALPGANYMSMSHGSAVTTSSSRPDISPGSGGLRVYIVQPGSYCARVYNPQTFGEVNREVADPDTALHLSGLKPSKYDNIVGSGTTLGNKTTVASACIVGDGCTLGDKSSIKRSVLGNNVRLGANVKVINSVIMDGVVVGDGCTIQNTLLCCAAEVKEKASLKDCQIGHGYIVHSGADYKEEVLATVPPA